MTAIDDIEIGITDHLEGGADAPSKRLFDVAADLVEFADQLGVRYAWFAEHHAHVHRGHLPTPLLFALHLAGRTRQISLGTAVICLNHHRALDVAEQVAVADTLSGGRMAVGFGSGSTPSEAALFGVPDMTESERHQHFSNALTAIGAWWANETADDASPRVPLPLPRAHLMHRCWSAVNSVGAARVAGQHNLNVLYSHLRTPQQYADYTAAYRDAGGSGLIAANRPIIIGETDEQANESGETAVRTLWRRFHAEGKIPAGTAEPESLSGVCAHPLNFIIGGPVSVARQIAELHRQSPFDVLNVELTWDGLDAKVPKESLRLLINEVLPRLKQNSAAISETAGTIAGSRRSEMSNCLQI